MIDVNQFFNLWNNKPCEVESPEYKNQCFDLALEYCDFLGIPREAIRHLYAYQIQTQPNDATIQYFEIIPNTLNGVPQLGDLVIWGDIVGTAGHVAVGTGKGNSKGFTSFDQNWPGGSVCHFQTHDYRGVTGWLRPRLLQKVASDNLVGEILNPDEVETVRKLEDYRSGLFNLDGQESDLVGFVGRLIDRDRRWTPLANELSILKNRPVATSITTNAHSDGTIVTLTTPSLATFSTSQLFSELTKRILGR